MKKTISILIVILISNIAFSQKLSFSKDIKGNYQQAMSVIAQKYNNAQKVIQYSDEKSGIIVARALFDFKPYSAFSNYKCTNGIIEYNMTITQKDSMIHIVIDNFIHKDNSDPKQLCSLGLITTSENANMVKHSFATQKWCNKVWNDIKERCILQSELLFNMFKDFE